MRRPTHNQRGFTLLELIVALSIFALLLSGVYGTFRAAERALDRVDTQSDAFQLTRALLGQIRGDFANLYPLRMAATTAEGEPYVPEVEPEAELEGVAAQPATEKQLAFVHENEVDDRESLDLDTISFVSASVDPAGTSVLAYDLAEITYYVDGDESTPEQGLVKMTNYLPGLAAEPVEPTTTEISREVVSLNFRFWDKTEGDWVEEWESQDGLPPMIEVTLGLVREEGSPPQLVQAVFEPRSTGLPEPASGAKAGGGGQEMSAEEEERPEQSGPSAPPSPTPPSGGGNAAGLTPGGSTFPAGGGAAPR